MIVNVNNEEVELAKEDKIFDLCKILKINSSKGIAIAINNNVVAREEWQTTGFKENDQVLIITATQGG